MEHMGFDPAIHSAPLEHKISEIIDMNNFGTIIKFQRIIL